MELTGVGKSPNSLSFRYNANNEELEELCFPVCEDDPPTPQYEPAPSHCENASPKRGERTSSIIDKYFKSIRTEKPTTSEKIEDVKPVETKGVEEQKSIIFSKEASSSPMKEYLNRLGKKSTSESSPDVQKEGSNETWKIFHDFKFKIAQAVEDMKTRSLEETKERSVPRENSTSDSEENSATKDLDQQSVGDTDNQVSSLDSSIQNLSEMTQPLTAKPTERESSLPADSKNHSESSEDTHRNLVYDASAEVMHRDILNDSNMMEVESGIEALEDNIDGYGDNIDTSCPRSNAESEQIQQPSPPNNFGFPPSRNNIKEPKKNDSPLAYFFNFPMYFLTFLIFVNYILFPNSNIWNGFLLGLWFFCFTSNLKCYVLDTYFTDADQRPSVLEMKRNPVQPMTYTIPVVKEHKPLKKYEGWINHYRSPDYDPFSYHINKTTTAFMKLEGCNLRISYTTSKIAKRALWDEKIENVAFYQHRLYNLTGARVMLLPKGLVRRRLWSKKYPICVILNEKETIQVLEKESTTIERKSMESPTEKKKEQHEMETETNVSPEKKKKFVWRRREKSISHSEAEPGKEGLRHRLVRKMHRDKKSDCVTTATGTETAETQSQSQVQTDMMYLEENHQEGDLNSTSATSTKDDIDEELDDTDMNKIKDLLEETERDTGPDSTEDGEWSMHIRPSTDKHSHLFLFGRTGRDKHEWYRRLVIAIMEANTSAEPSTTEEKTNNASTTCENKEGIEMSVYKVAEKDTVAFVKSSKNDVGSEGGGVTISSLSQSFPEPDLYEKTFWPYLLKIIQGKATPPNECECRTLPAEVTWVNAIVARVMYDIMRDPVMISRLQDKIQRKLNTLKLPSFMSPLVVTELSLAGACPLVERVAAPACDARGVWLDADVRYDGGAYIALLTQINLLKLKEKNVTLEEQLLATRIAEAERPSSGMFAERHLRISKPAIFESDLEDSAESSSDDESPPMHPIDSEENILPTDNTFIATPGEQGGSSKKKFLRMVDKIATNKYFQQVTDYKYVKRAMEGLSNTDIKLHLEVHALEGRIALNLPAPPHDRLWIGFRTNPQLVLKARPAVGARTLRFAHISNWIEQKLSKEFEKILVLPNMEDIIIDVLTPTPVQFE